MIRRLALIVAVVAPTLAGAVLPHEQLADPSLEARARTISKELRCQVCQNQSIDDSYAPLAGDLRRLVRERLTAGDSDAQVIAFVTQRYGDYVLLNPPMRLDTILLWSAPFAFLLAGAVGLFLWTRRRPAAATAPLSAEEESALAALLARDGREREPR